MTDRAKECIVGILYCIGAIVIYFLLMYIIGYALLWLMALISTIIYIFK